MRLERSRVLKKYIIGVCKSVAILVIGTVIGVALLCAALCISVDPDIKEESLSLTSLEGYYPLANYIHKFSDKYFTSYRPGVLDNNTDGRVIMPKVFTEPERGVLFEAMNLNGYGRYWHGYIVILRPLMHFIDYWDYRILNSFLQLALLVFISFSVWDRLKDKKYIIALWSSYFLLMPIALFMSLQYSPCFYIAFGGIAFAVRKKDYLREKQRYFYFFLILGMLTTYFDLLTYPLVTWGLPLLWWLVSTGDDYGASERFRKTVFTGIGWIVGYGGFWAMKWVVASLILGRNMVTSAIEQIFLRTGDVTPLTKSLLHAYERWESIYANWRHYQYSLYCIIIIAWMLWALYHIVRRRWKLKLSSAPYLLIALSPMVWYIVLSNHTTIHHLFTHRIYVVGILAFIMLLSESMCEQPVERVKTGIGKYAVSAILWGISAVLGITSITFAREDIDAIYGEEYQPIEIYEGDTVNVKFTPTFSQIRNIGFCAHSDTGEGYCRIMVTDDGECLEQLEIPMSEYTELTYYQQAVKWELKAGRQYDMIFSYRGSVNGEGMELLITNPGNMPLNEYSDLSLNDGSVEGQPLGSFTYHPHIQSRLYIMYNAGLCTVFIGTILQMIMLAIMALQKRRIEE